jgi:hypothetical protein
MLQFCRDKWIKDKSRRHFVYIDRAKILLTLDILFTLIALGSGIIVRPSSVSRPED